MGEREFTDDCDDCERNDEFELYDAPELFEMPDALLTLVEIRDALRDPLRDD